MGRSIRFRLLAWYAAVLAAVVGGYTGWLYSEARAVRLRALDSSLTAAQASLAAALRLFPKEELSGEPFPFHPPDAPPPIPREKLLATLQPPVSQPPVRYTIWRADGTVMKTGGGPALPGPPDLVGKIAFRDEDRELAMPGPGGTAIVVACDARGVAAETSRFAGKLALIAGLVLGIGLVGGWFLSRHLVRPLIAIAMTARAIVAGRFDRRVPTRHLDEELADVAGIVNRAFDQLQQAHDRQAQFTADASHELRNPIAVIRSQAELSLSRPRTPEEYRAALESCLRTAERMTDLVERLLLLARADAGGPGFRTESVSLDRVVSDAIDQLLNQAEKKNVTLRIDLARVQVGGDSSALGQVAVNLIANAIRYNRAGGQVDVRLLADGQGVELVVEDTGIGIPAELRPHLFERFARADQARARASGGAGLGLAICKAIVDAHGGTITITSVPQVGTTVRVRLPALPTETKSPSVREVPETKGS